MSYELHFEIQQCEITSYQLLVSAQKSQYHASKVTGLYDFVQILSVSGNVTTPAVVTDTYWNTNRHIQIFEKYPVMKWYHKETRFFLVMVVLKSQGTASVWIISPLLYSRRIINVSELNVMYSLGAAINHHHWCEKVIYLSRCDRHAFKH